MTFLILSIAFSVLVSVFLKIARRQGISIEVAIGVNYLVAITLSWFILKPDLSAGLSNLAIVIIVALGILLPTIFVVMGRSVVHAGIVKSDAAQRLSLIIPIIASFTVFGEEIAPQRLLGVVIAFVALGFLLHKPREMDTDAGEASSAGSSASLLTVAGLLIAVWAGYGTIDILFKQMAKQGSAFPATLMFSFIAAAVIMWPYLLTIGRSSGQKTTEDGSVAVSGAVFNTPSIIGGIILGCLNFGNILFYLKAHQAMSENPSIVFAGMNMGVISLGTLVGALVFREKMTWVNALGILIALVAVGLLNLTLT